LHAAQQPSACCNTLLLEVLRFIKKGLNVRLRAARAQAAKKTGKAPDFFYCKQLLEETGIVTVPGGGFKQVRLPALHMHLHKPLED
jgi:aspartate/methionine/tyrosine aminotransferase